MDATQSDEHVESLGILDPDAGHQGGHDCLVFLVLWGSLYHLVGGRCRVDDGRWLPLFEIPKNTNQSSSNHHHTSYNNDDDYYFSFQTTEIFKYEIA